MDGRGSKEVGILGRAKGRREGGCGTEGWGKREDRRGSCQEEDEMKGRARGKRALEGEKKGKCTESAGSEQREREDEVNIRFKSGMGNGGGKRIGREVNWKKEKGDKSARETEELRRRNGKNAIVSKQIPTQPIFFLPPIIWLLKPAVLKE